MEVVTGKKTNTAYIRKKVSLSPETPTPNVEIPKTSVARFKCFARSFPSNIGYSNTTKYIKDKGFPIGTTNSNALAYIFGYGWYAKAGCCQSIRDISAKASGNKVYYYIPNVFGLSLGKKLAYIEELQSIFPMLNIVGVQKGMDFINPENGAIDKCTISTEPSTVTVYPQPWLTCNEWIIVEAAVVSSAQYLYFLQFLRPLYQQIQLLYSVIPYSGYSVNYYQPRLYFKLKKLFPKLTVVQLLFLSFTIHGQVISGTYFPFYNVWLGYNPKLVVPQENNRINDSVKKSVTPKYVGDITFIDATIVRDTKWLSQKNKNLLYNIKTTKFSESYHDEYTRNEGRVLKDLVFFESTANYREAIRIISILTDDVSLLENIN